MAAQSPEEVQGEEKIARLLFHPQMVSQEGELKPNAFPMDDLVEANGRSVSVDRCGLLGKDFHQTLAKKAAKFANPDTGRHKHGYCLAIVRRVRAILGASNEQLFEVQADAIAQARPDPWDRAHAKIVRACPSHGKGYLRSHRDKLCTLFSEGMRRV